MKTTFRTLTLTILVALIVAAAGIGYSPAASAAESAGTLLDKLPGDQFLRKPIATDGQTVVWYAPSSDNAHDYYSLAQIRGARLRDHEPFVIANFPVTNHQEFLVDVDGDWVVWANARSHTDPASPGPEIRARRLSGVGEYIVANQEIVPSMGRVTSLAVSASTGLVVWSTYSQDEDIAHILARDVRGHAETFMLQEQPGTIYTNEPPLGHVQIDGDTAAWGVDASEYFYYANVAVQNLRDLTTDITPIDLFERWSGGFQYAGGKIVYQVLLEIDTPLNAAIASHKIIDVETEESRIVSMRLEVGPDPANPSETPVVNVGQERFAFDGRFIFQSFHVGPPQNNDWYLLAYDTWTDSYFRVTTGYPFSLDASNGALAWILGPVGQEVHGAYIGDLLPSAPLPDPGKTDRAWLYFKETGHYLSYGFKDFWVRSGGLPVFGFPMTTEYDELNPDLDEFRTVQYTERQRYEYHPELAGTHYETLLGRLGAADAERRGLLDHAAFQRVEDPAATGVEYFNVTGQTLRGRFRDYWHSHGLEFGDAGISHRESLALFGYPISEEFVDPATGLVTQYFERAVFEYHPDNPEPYKVLLRRLGAEELVRRGWVHEPLTGAGNIAFVVYEGDYDIYTIREDGSGLTNLTPDSFWNDDPVWSPDGSKILFTSDRAGTSDLYVMNADGTEVRRLTDGPGTARFPSWSPDGTMIAFTAYPEGTLYESAHLYVMNADGSGMRQVRPHPWVTRPSWSPDGSRIVYATSMYRSLTQAQQESVIHVVNVADAVDTPLTLDLGHAINPAWSPDGSRIAFIQGVGGSMPWLETLHVMNPDGSGKTALATCHGLCEFQWSPDGSEILLLRDPNRYDPDDVQLVIVAADGSSETVIRIGNLEGALTWSPDGKRVAFIENWGALTVVNRDGTGRTILTDDVRATSKIAWTSRRDR
jgi:Tol biopolymer transport system component